VRLHSHHPLLLRFPGTAVGVVAVYNPSLMRTSGTTVRFAIKLWIRPLSKKILVDELWIERFKRVESSSSRFEQRIREGFDARFELFLRDHERRSQRQHVVLGSAGEHDDAAPQRAGDDL
jgi:hypothetical protein